MEFCYFHVKIVYLSSNVMVLPLNDITINKIVIVNTTSTEDNVI